MNNYEQTSYFTFSFGGNSNFGCKKHTKQSLTNQNDVERFSMNIDFPNENPAGYGIALTSTDLYFANEQGDFKKVSFYFECDADIFITAERTVFGPIVLYKVKAGKTQIDINFDFKKGKTKDGYDIKDNAELKLFISNERNKNLQCTLSITKIEFSY